MIKRMLLALGVSFILLGVAACSENSNEGQPLTLSTSQPLMINDDLLAVSLEVLGDVSRETNVIDLRLFNGSDHTIIYGEAFSIEFFDGEAWNHIAVDTKEYIFFNDIGYWVEPETSSYFERRLDIFVPNGLFQSSRYRLRMQVFSEADIPIREHHLHDVVAEFYVE